MNEDIIDCRLLSVFFKSIDLTIKNRPSENLSDGLLLSNLSLTAKIVSAFAPVLADGAAFADRCVLFDFSNKIRSADNRMRAGQTDVAALVGNGGSAV